MEESTAAKHNQVTPQTANGISKVKFRRRQTLAQEDSDASTVTKSQLEEAPVVYKDYFGTQVVKKGVEKQRMTYLQKLVIADMSSIFFAISGLAYEMYSVASIHTV